MPATNSFRQKLLILLFLIPGFTLRAQDYLYLSSGVDYGRTLSQSTYTTGLYPELLQKQNGLILSLHTGLTAIFKRVVIGAELRHRFQNWVFDSYAVINNLSATLGYEVLKKKRISLIPFIGCGLFVYRDFDILSSGEVFYAYNDSILYTTSTSYQTVAASKINLTGGIRFIWKTTENSSLHFSFRYTRGLEPFLFMDLEAEHVQLGPGSSKAQYDGSALLFSVSYGVNLIGLRQRLKKTLQ